MWKTGGIVPCRLNTCGEQYCYSDSTVAVTDKTLEYKNVKYPVLV